MFNLIKIENGRINVPEPLFYEATANEAITSGEALVLTAGKLTKCGATVKPQYIAIGSCTAAQTDRTIAVCRVEGNQVYEVPVTAAPTSLTAGSLVTIDTSGLSVTATTTSGVVTVVDLLGATKAGEKILVRIA